jgi:hypothetical protein
LKEAISLYGFPVLRRSAPIGQRSKAKRTRHRYRRTEAVDKAAEDLAAERDEVTGLLRINTVRVALDMALTRPIEACLAAPATHRRGLC